MLERERKELRGHIDGSNPAPHDAKALSKWKIKDAQVMTWILSSVEPHLVLNLRPYKTVAAMWNYFHSLFSDVQAVHATSKRDQFLMKLRPDFEITWSNLMNRHPVPSLDAWLSELLREEQRIVTQATMEHRANVSAPVSVSSAAQGRNKGRDMHAVQGFSCKDFGHIAWDCPKKFCNYCKKQGHIISACPIRPERKQGTTYHAFTGVSSSTTLPATLSIVPIPAPTALANPNTLTPEMDRVSEKMIAKGPKVERLFPLHVSHSTIFPLLSFACNSVGSGYKMWHKRLSHPNSDVLCTLFNFGLLGNKACSSLDLSFDCTSCKLGKSKVLPFPHPASRVSQCFDIIHSDVWGIAPIVSHAYYKYFVTFINDFNCFTWVYFLRAKAEVFSVFKRFLALIETQFSASIKALRSDSSKEYMSNKFQDFLQSKGIIS
ncbi:Retrovirus-related Pol polyprotein from transposon TNT 1-94 [Vitis vinifera]|uniref:Retrovirus-related Pol polyprotein from transposon TNT 1-94 n=1 Tax=Vitis vinifera TaxID=29760 RepID=A0A438EDV8_VITVI|nr:Retrovirus-related Pol polyprotein from transposon TNT 1-94 [Vitis vinifera]